MNRCYQHGWRSHYGECPVCKNEKDRPLVISCQQADIDELVNKIEDLEQQNKRMAANLEITIQGLMTYAREQVGGVYARSCLARIGITDT